MSARITGDYIAGFVDGEGCFSLSYRKDKGKYFYWKVLFAIVLRKDDKEIIKKIHKFLNCGNYILIGEYVRYQIAEVELLVNKIIPFFEKYPLIGKKGNDFKLWKEAVLIIYRNKKKKVNSEKNKKGFQKNKWNNADLVRLKEIRNEMLVYKGGGSKRVFKHQGS